MACLSSSGQNSIDDNFSKKRKKPSKSHYENDHDPNEDSDTNIDH